MKKLLRSAIVLSMMLIFTGCGKDPLSQQMIDDIKSIEEVTLDDKGLIEDIESTYSEMTEKQKNQVDNYVDLKQARKELDVLIAEEEERQAEEERKRQEEEQKRLEEEQAQAQAELEALVSEKPYSVAIAYARRLRDSFKDPSSFELLSATYSTDNYYDFYALEVSGTNSYGGTITNIFVGCFTGINTLTGEFDLNTVKSYNDYYSKYKKSKNAENLDVDIINQFL